MRYRRSDAEIEAIEFLDSTERITEITEFIGNTFSISYEDKDNPFFKYTFPDGEVLMVNVGDYVAKIPLKTGNTILACITKAEMKSLLDDKILSPVSEDIVEVNRVELASTLAERSLMEYYMSSSLPDECWKVTDSKGNTSYTKEAQKRFDGFYDEFYNMIVNSK